MEPVGRPDASGHDARGGATVGELANRLVGPGDHAAAELVDSGEVDVRGQVGRDVVGTRGHSHHGTRRGGVHQTCPRRNGLDRRIQVKNSGHGGSHEFADAVAGQCRRGYPVRDDQLRQSIFHGEQGGLGQVGGLQRGPLEHLYLEVDAQFRSEASGAPVEDLSEHRLGVVEAAGHADVLSSLAGKHEGDPLCARGNARRAGADRYVVVLGGGQHGDRVRAICDNGGKANLVQSSVRQRECHVGKLDVNIGVERGRKGSLGVRQRIGGAGGQQQHLRAARRMACRGRRRSLLDYDVRVGAADTE